MQPFDHTSIETTAPGKSILKPPACDVKFQLHELEDDQCRLVMRIRGKNRGALARLKLFLAGPMIRREWQGHYANLIHTLREDIERADATGATAGG